MSTEFVVAVAIVVTDYGGVTLAHLPICQTRNGKRPRPADLSPMVVVSCSPRRCRGKGWPHCRARGGRKCRRATVHSGGVEIIIYYAESAARERCELWCGDRGTPSIGGLNNSRVRVGGGWRRRRRRVVGGCGMKRVRTAFAALTAPTSQATVAPVCVCITARTPSST